MRSYRRKNRKNRGTRRRKVIARFFIGGDKDKCIFVPLGGGLGNQLYVYAAAIVTKNKIGLPLCILPYKDNKHSATDYSKVLFKQGTPVEDSDVKERINAATKVLEFVKNPHNDFTETNIVANSSKNIMMMGSFYQNYESIKSAIPTIRSDFKQVFEERYPGFKDTIPNTAAFMHIRKGDYGNASLGADYYKNGLQMLDAVSEISVVFILSDDISWSKEQGFTSPKIKWFDNPDEQKDELKTMYLMSLCLAGACISASTFSSWGVILGADQNENSTILYPKSWITGNSSRIKFPGRWKAI